MLSLRNNDQVNMFLFLLYLVIVLGLVVFGLGSKEKKVTLVLLIIVMSLYWGITYLNTVDMPGYVDLYQTLFKGINPRATLRGLSYFSFEPAFLYLMQLFKDLNLPFYVFQLSLLSFEMILVGIGSFRLLGDYNKTILFLAAVSLYLPFWLMAAMRQGINIAVFIYVLPDIVNGKYWKPVVLILIASLFHSSGVFLLVLIGIYLLYKWFVKKKEDNLTILSIFVLVFCDLVYLSGISLSGFLDRITMLLFSDNPFLYRDYTIMSNDSDSNYGMLKFVEMNILYFLFFFSDRSKKKDDSMYILGCLFLIYFFVNTIAGGIIIHRLSYYLMIPYYFLFFKEVYRISKQSNLRYLGTFIFIGYLFALFFRQYHPFSSYVFEYFVS